jgi:hypothetical protein
MKKEKEKAEVRNSKWVGGWRPWQRVSSFFLRIRWIMVVFDVF